MVVDLPAVGPTDPTNISDGGDFEPLTRTVTWDLGDLASGEYVLTYDAIVADDVVNGEELVNAAAATSPNSQCPDLGSLEPECDDDSTVTPRVPTLVIDKVADTETITITGPNDALVATPSVVTWTLTYTLTNGPVTNAVITDEVPVRLRVPRCLQWRAPPAGVVTWTFATLTASGSVDLPHDGRSGDDLARRPDREVAAMIDSDETAPDEGEDSVTVGVEPPPQGGKPTPAPSVPDTAVGIGPERSADHGPGGAPRGRLPRLARRDGAGEREGAEPPPVGSRTRGAGGPGLARFSQPPGRDGIEVRLYPVY